MIRINLLPVRAAQKKARAQKELLVFCLVLALTVTVCVVSYTSMKVKVAKETKAVEECQQEIDKLKKTLGEVAHFKKLQTEFQGKLDVLAALKDKKSGPVHLLDELSRVLPEKLWLESFEEKRGRISMKGIALDEPRVAQFLRNLEASPYYRNVDLSFTKQASLQGVKVQKFDISCEAESPKKIKGEGSR
jgi:type IV pilus assembly protein PilN